MVHIEAAQSLDSYFGLLMSVMTGVDVASRPVRPFEDYWFNIENLALEVQMRQSLQQVIETIHYSVPSMHVTQYRATVSGLSMRNDDTSGHGLLYSQRTRTLVLDRLAVEQAG